MSCIPKILELKGDKKFLAIPTRGVGIIIEGGGNYKNYDFLVTFNDLGFRCGYVALPSDHPANNCKKDYPDYNVHGGVTFFQENHLSKHFFGEDHCKDKWIGFDAMHSGDRLDEKAFCKYFPRISEGRKEYIEIMQLRGTKVRTIKYMFQQCKNLINELIIEENN